MRDFIIKPSWGGLGDHLFYSHLPRIAAESGRYRKILVSNHASFRHPDYRTVVWETNPYVDGFTDADAPTPAFRTLAPGENILDRIMLSHGLDDGLRFHEPEVYFTPPKRPDLLGCIVYDPNYVSFVGNLSPSHVHSYFEQHNIRPDRMLVPRGRHAGVPHRGELLASSSLLDYCSIIVSAHQFICLTSGGATLAAALAKPALVLWASGQHHMFHHSPQHTYANVNANVCDRAFPRLARLRALWNGRQKALTS